MYKIIVTTTGKYNNVGLGERYCLTKRELIKLVKLFNTTECKYQVYKFIRLSGLTFAWGSTEITEELLEKGIILN